MAKTRRIQSLALRARNALTVPELHAVSREAALAATTREAEALDRALASIEEAEALVRAVSETALSATAAVEARAAAISLVAAVAHVRAALLALSKP